MSAIFRGRFEAKIDSKGRLSLPASLKGSLDVDLKTLVFTNGQFKKSPCLDVYLPKEWMALEKRIEKLSSLKPAVQSYRRFYISGGQFVDSDSNERFLVPKTLRQHAKVSNHVVLVGMGNKLEIWDGDIWNKVHGNLASDFDQTLAALAELEEQD